MQSSGFGPQHKRESGVGRGGEKEGRAEGGREKGAAFLNTFLFFSLQKKNSICCFFVTAEFQVLEISLHLSTKLPQESFVKITHTKKQVGSRPSGLTSWRSPG